MTIKYVNFTNIFFVTSVLYTVRLIKYNNFTMNSLIVNYIFNNIPHEKLA